MDLPQGKVTITMEVRYPILPRPMTPPDLPYDAFRFRALELTPQSGNAHIESVEQEAVKERASTDWLVKAKYGVWFHWTNRTMPRHGKMKSYGQAVEDFDVPAFARMVQETGAGYVVFAVCWADPTFPAPIKAWAKWHPKPTRGPLPPDVPPEPGYTSENSPMTTKRDLVREIGEALSARGIKLMLYISAYVTPGHPFIEPDLPENYDTFMNANREIFTEIGQRYGKLVAGYFYDSALTVAERIPNVDWQELYRVFKTGNPDRLVTLNWGVFPVMTPWQDYWAGETHELVRPTESRYLQYGTGKGLQSHIYLELEKYGVYGSSMVAGTVGATVDTVLEQREKWYPITPPRFSPNELIQFILDSNKNEGVVTVNIAIYQEGMISDQALDLMRDVRKAVRGE